MFQRNAARMRPGFKQWKGVLAQEMFDSFWDLAALTDEVLIHAARLPHPERYVRVYVSKHCFFLYSP